MHKSQCAQAHSEPTIFPRREEDTKSKQNKKSTIGFPRD